MYRSTIIRNLARFILYCWARIHRGLNTIDNNVMIIVFVFFVILL